MENPFKITKKDETFFKILVEFHIEQEGIFCIEEIREKMEKHIGKPFHREQAVRIIKILQKSKILNTIDNEKVRIIFEKNKKMIPKRLGKRHYYKIDLDSEFALWMRDNNRAIAIEVLKKDFGKEARPFISKLRKEIKTKSILNELKTLQIL